MDTQNECLPLEYGLRKDNNALDKLFWERQ